MIHRQPTSTLFPYTTLFRSERDYDTRRMKAEENIQDWNDEMKAEYASLQSDWELFKEDYIAEKSRREAYRSEEHTSELQSHSDLVCRLLLEKKKKINKKKIK